MLAWQTGMVGVWKTDSRGRLVSQCKMRKGNSAVTHIVFRTNDKRSPAGYIVPDITKKYRNRQVCLTLYNTTVVIRRGGDDTPWFYFSGEDGVVYAATDDKTLCKEVFRSTNQTGTAVLMYLEGHLPSSSEYSEFI